MAVEIVFLQTPDADIVYSAYGFTFNEFTWMVSDFV